MLIARRRYAALCAATLLLFSRTAAAHNDSAATLLTPDVFALSLIVTAGAGYAFGIARLWRRRVGYGVRPWQVWCYAAGLVALTLALLWPLDQLSASSFAAHMLQHMLLIAVAPPLLVLGIPLRAFGAIAALRWVFVRTPWKWAARPAGAFLLHGATVWLWHAPWLFQSALRSYPVHLFEHFTLFATSLVFWWALLHAGRLRASGCGTSAVLALMMIMHMGLLGALLTFAPRPLYPVYAERLQAFGLSALEDQQLAGLLMWVPGALIYLIAGIALIALWLRHAERRADGGADSDLERGRA